MKKILRYAAACAAATLCFYCLNKVFDAPLSVSLYIALLYSAFPPLPLAASFFAAALIQGTLVSVVSAATQAAVLGSLFLLYGRKNRKPNVEIVVYVFLSSLVYLIFDERAEIMRKLVYTAIISLFSATCAVGVGALKEKKFSVKFSKSETLCLVCALLFVAVGFLKAFGTDVYKGVSVAAIIIAVGIFDDETPAIVTAALASVFTIVYGQTRYLVPYALYYVVFYAFNDKNRILAALGVFSVEAVFAFYFEYFGEYGYLNAATFFLPVLVAALVPVKFFDASLQNGYLSYEQALNKTAFNAMRSFTASELSSAADAFSQIKTAINSLSSTAQPNSKLVQKMAASVKNSCEKCPNYQKCSARGEPKVSTLEKISEIGIAKKRVTIIDLPKDLLETCAFPNNVIFEVNRLIEGLSETKEKSEKTEGVKKIMSYVACGMEGFLRKNADDYSNVLPFDAKTEREIIKLFKRNGVRVKGLTIRKNAVTAEICVLYEDKNFDEKKCVDVLSDFFARPVRIDHARKISTTSSVARITFADKFGCAYGVSVATKFSSPVSGDVYSVERISENKVLIALSDGMGSGEGANATSDSAISLIEGFYKAGFDSKTVLPLVNKILSFVTEDDFSAVDICVFDVTSGETDFIKIGAPYGFILSKDGVRFLEGSSLPLGILDTLSPTVAQTTLTRGDILILLSDGVTDAFGASSEMIDFLKTAPLSNPQELADSIVKKALSLSGNYAADDMTAFCTRIY